MDGEDFSGLFDAPDAQAARIAALRRQRGAGSLGLLTGDRVLSRFGTAMLDEAGRGGAELAAAQRFSLQRALEAQRQKAAREAELADAARKRQEHLADVKAGQDFSERQQGRALANTLRVAGITADMTEARQRGAETRAEARATEKEVRAAEAKKAAATTDVEERYQNVISSLDRLAKRVGEVGTFEATGPANAEMEGDVTTFATDMAKLMDPSSVAREGEVELQKRALFSPGVGGLLTSNETALKLIEAAKQRAAQRRQEAYRVRGLEAPGTPPAAPVPTSAQPSGRAPGGRVLVTNGQETLEVDPADLGPALKAGYRRVDG